MQHETCFSKDAQVMLHHCKVVLFGLFIATFTAAVASATTYTITSLLPAGDTTSEAIGIDQSGDVVGSCTTAAGKIDGMLYTGGVAMDMGMVPVWSPPSGAGGGIISVASTVFNSVAVSAEHRGPADRRHRAIQLVPRPSLQLHSLYPGLQSDIARQDVDHHAFPVQRRPGKLLI